MSHGSDRLAEVTEILGMPDDEIVVNLQGDEPLLPPQTIRQVAEDLGNHPDADMDLLCSPLEHIDDIFDPNVVKTILDKGGYAIYFSRAPAPLETIECLEQLRALWNGKRLYCGVAKNPSPGPSVDTEDDLHKVREIYLSLK